MLWPRMLLLRPPLWAANDERPPNKQTGHHFKQKRKKKFRRDEIRRLQIDEPSADCCLIERLNLEVAQQRAIGRRQTTTKTRDEIDSELNFKSTRRKLEDSNGRRRAQVVKMDSEYENPRRRTTTTNRRNIVELLIVLLLLIVINCSMETTSLGTKNNYYYHNDDGIKFAQSSPKAAARRRPSSSPSPNLPQTQAADQSSSGRVEVGEGLTLNTQQQQPDDADQSASSSSSSNQLFHLPAKQMEKIKLEHRVHSNLGQNVVLNCPVQFSDGQEKPFVVNWLKYPNKLPIYIWYAGYPPHVAQGYENRVARLGQASLNLSSIRSQDQGFYECKIYYLDRKPDDKANGTWIYLDVQAPPRFTRTPAPVNYVQAGDSVHLTCQAQSSPAPILRWYKNKVPIDSDAGAYRLSAPLAADADNHNHNNSSSSANNEDNTPDATTTNESEQQRGRRPPQTTTASSSSVQDNLAGQSLNQLDLFIDNVQAGSTTGDYVCLASNSEGSIEARSSVQLAVGAVITTLPRNQTRLEAERVEFACQAKALPSNITYKWLFNEKPLQQLKWFESRYTQKRDGTLIIHSIHRDDQGEYKCQASNGLSPGRAQSHHQHKQSVASQRVAEASAYLQVEFPARVTYSPAIQYLPIGLSGLIRCFYQASPQVEFFTWTLNNQQFDPNVDPNVERLQNGSLLIKQVNKQYEGKYRCTPFNKHGSAGSSNAMEVRVEQPPQFELRPADFYKANLNGQVKIPCEGRGSPKPVVSWRRVGTATDRTRSSGGYSTSSVDQLNGGGGQATTRSSSQFSRLIRPKRLDASSPEQPQRLISPASNGGRLDDEAADEPDETHHFYTPTSTSTSSPFANQLNDEQQQYEQLHEQEQTTATTTSLIGGGGDESAASEQQQPVTVYAKLPSDRSEFKNSHLYLHNLRKEDHGRYECVIENEVATLIASTMLYIEETTPHAPTDVRVDTKAWSAFVSWTPGYDGGFEQSFVVWYRQVDHRPRGAGHVAAAPFSRAQQQQQQTNELIDINWHSANVQPSDSNSFTIENLSQDTVYEFYVRAKNIIGEGPRSQIVQAQTKRAISGSVTPMIDPALPSTMMTNSNQQLPADETAATPLPAHETNTNEEEETAEPKHSHHHQQQQLITIRQPVAIIRPEIIQHQRHQQHQGYDTTSASTNSQQDDFMSTNQTNHNNLQQTQDYQQPSNMIESSQQQQQSEDQQHQPQENSSKVIRFKLIPTNSTQHQQQANNGKRAPQQTNLDSSSSSNYKQPAATNETQVPVDRSTAPTNVSITKVAQGWVLEWSPPERLPTPPPSPDELQLADPTFEQPPKQRQQDPASEQLIDGLNKRQQQQQPPPQPSAISSSSSGFQPQLLEPTAYTVELREKSQHNWHTLASIGRERSLLIKDLKPGGEYLFRVLAHSPSGLKGAPSQEFKYQIPDNRRKPGSTQALSAGVVSGVLFFIACIVIAVCGVNMCNKRRKKRAEKAAYVMMACPVLESHHDIAALNSNSLMKNSQCNNFNHSAQNRVSSLATDQQRRTNNYLSDNLNYLNQRRRSSVFSDLKNGHDAKKSRQFKNWFVSNNKFCQFLRTKLGFDSKVPDSGTTTTTTKDQQQPNENELQREIQFGLNSPLPVDVEPIEAVARRPLQIGESLESNSAANEIESAAPMDDYWIRQPSDRKWGTLTLAAGKLAERRAELRQKKQQQQQASGETMQGENGVESSLRTTGTSRTLPRSFRNTTSEFLNELHDQQQQQFGDPESWSRLREKFFNKKRQQQQHLGPPDVPPRLANNHHQRSLSQIEPPNFWPQAAAPSSFNNNHQTATRQLAAAACWPGAPATNYFASIQANDHGWLASNQHQSFVMPPPPPLPPLVNGSIGGHQMTMKSCLDQPDNSCFSGKRNSLARSTLPIVAQVSCGQTILAPPYNQAHDLSMYSINCNQSTAMANNNSNSNHDDPVTANACLGSYKRKRRLPHIEAQFTITKPALNQPEPRSGGGHKSTGDCHSTSQLFVRELQTFDQRAPPGFPLSGQRSEQKQLRLLMPSSGAAQAEQAIDPRVKIETYLRHHDEQQQQQLKSKNKSERDTNKLSKRPAGQPPPPPIELDKVDAITFQPYYNLPSLCYTINLPVKKQPDGKLILEETSQLKAQQRKTSSTATTSKSTRLRRRVLKRRVVGKVESNDNSISERKDSSSLPFNNARHSTSRRPQLGSSSSCPAEAAAQTNEDDEIGDELKPASKSSLSSVAHMSFHHHQQQLKQVCSLESAIENPLIANKPIQQQSHLVAETVSCGVGSTSLFAPDSLEQLEDPFEMVLGDNLPPPPPLLADECATNNLSHDYSSVAELAAGDEVQSRQQQQQNQAVSSRPLKPPPPVPAHQAATTKTSEDKPPDHHHQNRRRTRPSPSSSSSSSSSSDEDRSRNSTQVNDQTNNSSSSSTSSSSCTKPREVGMSRRSVEAKPSESSSLNNGTTTGDQSVDENYEFDQNSSPCSSPSNEQGKLPGSAENATRANETIYAQVDKQTKRTTNNKRQTTKATSFNDPANSATDADEFLIVQRAHHFIGSRFKEQKLSTATRRATTFKAPITSRQQQIDGRETFGGAQNGINMSQMNTMEQNYYDTVYDAYKSGNNDTQKN